MWLCVSLIVASSSIAYHHQLSFMKGPQWLKFESNVDNPAQVLFVNFTKFLRTSIFYW